MPSEGSTWVDSRYYVASLDDGRIVTGDLRRGGPSKPLLAGATGRQLRDVHRRGIRVLDRTHVVLDYSTAGGPWSVELGSGRAVQIPVPGGPTITGGDGLDRR